MPVEMLANRSVAQLEALRLELMEEYESYRAMGLDLDMSRGKPSARQLDLCQEMLDTVTSRSGTISESGIDCRNYGYLDGLPEVRQLLANMLEVGKDEIIVGGNSSLNMMYDCMTRALLYGVYGSDKPWCKEPEIKFLCPVPGYDRHFAITQHFGIRMINIDMTDEGPNMDQVERYVESDPAVKGIWCVPKYSNPTGITYSDRVVERFAGLTPAARDFRIFWDNAYTVHDLYDEGDHLLDLFSLLKEKGKEDMIFIFGSTSKISFAGAGLAAVAASRKNIAFMRRQLAIQTISYDKITQLMHVRFFQDLDHLKEHMKKHAAILRPKFQMVEEILTRELDGLGIARWTRPRGGYFISFDTLPGCAKRTVALCKEAGVTLTAAGAAFPYGIDPKDTNIRIAPSYPELGELEQAAKLFCLAVKIASVEYLLTTSV